MKLLSSVVLKEHDFSRADKANKINAGLLAPAKSQPWKKPQACTFSAA
jgi:hypothetical protein